MYACYWFERQSLRETIDYLGPDNLMFETDFPHPTCLVKKDLDKAAEVLAALPVDERRKITGGTAAKVYNLTLPT
jgi:predicted TIM-barrel fold metal-dependent hydrolase